MIAHLRVVSSTDVINPATFGVYSHQTIGTKRSDALELGRLQEKLDTFFADTPFATYSTLVTTVGYVRARHMHPAMPWSVLKFVPWAFKDGLLPELDPRNHALQDSNVEFEISWILEREHDDWWVNALTFATGVENRRAMVKLWKNRSEAIGA